MPAKGSTGTTRSKPLRSDRGVKLYAPTPSKPFFRVVAIGQHERTSERVPVALIADSRAKKFDSAKIDPVVAKALREADDLFDKMVLWAKSQPSAPRRGDRSINALCDRRLKELRDRDRARGTIAKNEDLMRLYVRPVIGHVEVADWTSEHSREVIRAARKTCGDERIQDLGRLLRSLVTLAHLKPVWLAKDEDPMEGVDYTTRSRAQGVTAHFVPLNERPSTQQVDSLAKALGERGRQVAAYLAGRPNNPVQIDRNWGNLLVQVSGKSGPRAGEAFALTVLSCARPRAEVEATIAVDVLLSAKVRKERVSSIIDLPHGYAIDPQNRVIAITETVEWDKGKPYIAPPEERASGKEPKSKKTRETIYPKSLVDPIVERCRILLERFGPERGPHALLFPEHDHRFVLVPVDPKRPKGPKRWQDQDWWSLSDFRRSMYRPAVAAAEFWPDEPPFPYENLRHHFATWAKSIGYSDELITNCMGHHSVDYTQKRYFRTGADTIAQGMAASNNL